MDITAFIRELLFSHDCVIVPGFGGFIGNYTSARIDKGTSTFYPPVKKISFNRNLNNNDGLLAGRISGSLKVNYKDALNLVEEFAASVRKRLEKGEKVVFDNIGSFTCSQEGNIQFDPEYSVNYHLDSYGLESFQFLPAEGYDIRKRITNHINKEPSQNPSIRKNIWRAAVIIPLIGIMVAVPIKMNLFKSKLETSNLNPLITAEFEDNRKAVDEVASDMPPEAGVIEPESPDDVEAAGVPVSEASQGADENKDGFYVIVGSFRVRENADHQVNLLKEKGFSPEIIPAPNGYFRVSAIKCPDLATALSRKEHIEITFHGAWVKKI